MQVYPVLCTGVLVFAHVDAASNVPDTVFFSTVPDDVICSLTPTGYLY